MFCLNDLHKKGHLSLVCRSYYYFDLYITCKYCIQIYTILFWLTWINQKIFNWQFLSAILRKCRKYLLLTLDFDPDWIWMGCSWIVCKCFTGRHLVKSGFWSDIFNIKKLKKRLFWLLERDNLEIIGKVWKFLKKALV